jgi:hypothetical protein
MAESEYMYAREPRTGPHAGAVLVCHHLTQWGELSPLKPVCRLKYLPYWIESPGVFTWNVKAKERCVALSTGLVCSRRCAGSHNRVRAWADVLTLIREHG